jgi:hypothetical protein
MTTAIFIGQRLPERTDVYPRVRRLVRGIEASGASTEDEAMDTLSIAASGVQSASSWLDTATSKVAAGSTDPVDAVDAYVAAPLAYAADARLMEVALATTRTLFDALA